MSAPEKSVFDENGKLKDEFSSAQLQQHITNDDIHVKGEITEAEIDDTFDMGVYLIMSIVGEVTDKEILIVSEKSGFIFGDMVTRVSQLRIISDGTIKQRFSANNIMGGAWQAWEYYALLSDLTPILSDISDLSSDKQNKIQGATKTANSVGSAGDIAYDNDYFYLCVATNTWIRFAKTAW